MASPLLETKLHVPRRRRSLVARPRLLERLSRESEPELTLVSAPAGFGKTTLLAEWLAGVSADGRSVAWLSLDESDNDPALFWTYVIAALQTAVQGVGGRALSLLQSAQPPIETVLATVLNELGALSNDVVLVLDDYHLVDAGDVQDGMAFLLEHLPPQLHLVISSRADPALPLARLRGARRAGRGPRRRPALHARRGGGLPQRGHGAGADGTGHRRAGGAHRRLDRRAPAGRAVDAGTRRRRRLHRRVRGGRPVHRRLPGRGGPAAAVRAGPALPAADLHPGPAERPAVRCRHRPARREGHARGAGPREPVRGPARRQPPLVPLPPPLRGHPAGPSPGRASRRGRGPASPRQPVVRAERGAIARRSATRWPPGTSSEQRTWSSWRSRHCAGAGRRPRSGAGSTPSPTTWSGSGRCSRWASSGR